MAERNPYCVIDAPEFVVRARPGLTGTDDRWRDAAQAAFQGRLIRSYVDKPALPFECCEVTVDVPDIDDLPAAATLKSVLDTLKPAGLVIDDRNVLAARLRKYRPVEHLEPMVFVEVLPRNLGDGYFVRSTEQHRTRRTGRPVTCAVPYVYRSGVPGEPAYLKPWAKGPADYEALLRRQWSDMLEGGCVRCDVPMDTFPLTASRLMLHLPEARNEDPDNALLYVLDMLELAVRAAAGGRELNVDRLLTEVWLGRDLDSGMYLEVETVQPLEQDDVWPYYSRDGEPLRPIYPESPVDGDPDDLP